MAEFCLDCWNKINDTFLTEKDVILAKELDLCEGCGEAKRVLVAYRKRSIFKRLLEKLTSARG